MKSVTGGEEQEKRDAAHIQDESFPDSCIRILIVFSNRTSLFTFSLPSYHHVITCYQDESDQRQRREGSHDKWVITPRNTHTSRVIDSTTYPHKEPRPQQVYLIYSLIASHFHLPRLPLCPASTMDRSECSTFSSLHVLACLEARSRLTLQYHSL